MAARPKGDGRPAGRWMSLRRSGVVRVPSRHAESARLCSHAGGRAVSRIIAGVLGGRRLATPSGRGTRPTSDRVREALFSSLATMLDLDGARVADLYAGSGAVGLEAASRGASWVLLVEADPRVARIARDNVTALGVGDRARVVPAKVEQIVAVA